MNAAEAATKLEQARALLEEVRCAERDHALQGEHLDPLTIDVLVARMQEAGHALDAAGHVLRGELVIRDDDEWTD